MWPHECSWPPEEQSPVVRSHTGLDRQGPAAVPARRQNQRVAAWLSDRGSVDHFGMWRLVQVADEYPYTLTAHAAQVISERQISLEWVARTLSDPEKREPDRYDPALRHALARIPERGNRVLRVVYDENVHPWRIVTAYFDRSQKGKL